MQKFIIFIYILRGGKFGEILPIFAQKQLGSLLRGGGVRVRVRAKLSPEVNKIFCVNFPSDYSGK
jgi:hypothetical protein